MKLNELNLEVGAGTETGYVRKENHDRMSWATVPCGQLYTIADGIGDHVGGALAAELTVYGLERYLADAPENMKMEDAIRNAFDKTNTDVYETAHSGDPETKGIGSTAVILLITKQVAKIAHVGNSRAYLYRDGKLRLLTKDHTQVQRFVDAGMMKPEKARNHPSASLLERAMGHRPTVTIGIGSDLVLKEGDGILLCSDGLSAHAEDLEIEAAMSGSSTPQETVNRLINLALKNGGEDNVTIQYVRYGKNSEVRHSHSDYASLLKPVFWTFLAACIAGGASFLTYMRVKDSAEKNVSSLQKTIAQVDSELLQQITKIKNLEQQVTQLNDNVSSRNEELENTKTAERLAVNQARKLEKKLNLEIRAKKQLENKLKTITQEKNSIEKDKLIATQTIKKLEAKESFLKKRIKTLETQLKLLYLRSPISDKGGK